MYILYMYMSLIWKYFPSRVFLTAFIFITLISLILIYTNKLYKFVWIDLDPCNQLFYYLFNIVSCTRTSLAATRNKEQRYWGWWELCVLCSNSLKILTYYLQIRITHVKSMTSFTTLADELHAFVKSITFK